MSCMGEKKKSIKRWSCKNEMDEAEETFMMSLEVTVLVDCFQKYLINS